MTRKCKKKLKGIKEETEERRDNRNIDRMKEGNTQERCGNISRRKMRKTKRRGEGQERGDC